MDLALEANISPRHLSYIESGKSQASRDVLARLADVLGVSLRERNGLMLAAGYAPQFSETAIDAPSMAMMHRAVQLILAQQEPYPAFVVNRYWDVLAVNNGAMRINQLVMKGKPSRHTNILHQICDPDDIRSAVVNWEDVAEKFLHHLHQEIAASPTAQRPQELLGEILRYPGIPARWRSRDCEAAAPPILTMTFRTERGDLSFFETITTFARACDVTLDEMRIDCAFPADDFTADICASLASEDADIAALKGIAHR